MQKYANLVDLIKSFPTSIYLQKSASIQPRTSPLKFAHLAAKSESGSISNLSTKISTAPRSLFGLFLSPPMLGMGFTTCAWSEFRRVSLPVLGHKCCNCLPVVGLVLGCTEADFARVWAIRQCIVLRRASISSGPKNPHFGRWWAGWLWWS